MKARIPNQGGQANMMKRIQQMQEEMTRVQQECEAAEYSASAGGGAIDVTVNGNTATLDVTMGIMYADANEQGDLDFFIDPKPTTVTFQKTKDGWRISGGTMFELLYDGTFPGYGPLPSPSPETTDATPMLWLISVISLAGMCAVIRKRKTR